MVGLGLFLAVVATLVLSSPEAEGASTHLIERIIKPFVIGGEDATVGQFPDIVSIQIEGQHLCGGTLIDPNWVLTAAHCMDDLDLDGMTVLAGAPDLQNEGSAAVRREVEGYVVHEDYDNENFLNHDVALLKLSDPMPLSPTVKIAKLQSNMPSTGESSIIAGWGKTSDANEIGSPTLQYVTIEITDRDVCKKALFDIALVHDNQICAGHPAGGRGQCKGDSGGPLYTARRQVGIVSWSKKPCAQPGQPGVFAGIPQHIDWIRKVTHNDDLGL